MADDSKKNKNDTIKRKTLRLYGQLTQIAEERMERIDIRDKVIELNYAFFGYVASTKFINNNFISYEDKMQSAIRCFCEIWWKYMFTGDATHRGYRTDLSFAVFFKPRIGEMMERELNEVKYSIRRQYCSEVGDQLGKHWAEVRYDDLADKHVKLSSGKMVSLQAMFGSLYPADLEDQLIYKEAPPDQFDLGDLQNDQYNSITEFLVQEMIRRESKLTDSDIRKLSDTYQIPESTLHNKLPYAERILYNRLVDRIDAQECHANMY